MMKTLNKTLMITLATLGLASAVYAQSDALRGGRNFSEHCGPHEGWQRGKHDPAIAAKFMEKRLADMHTRLKLTDQQEGAWKSFTDKIKPAPATERPDFAALSKLPTPERLDRMETFRKEHQLRQTTHIAAVKEFYGQLTAEQQKVFDANFMQPPQGRPDGKAPKGKPDGKGRPDSK